MRKKFVPLATRRKTTLLNDVHLHLNIGFLYIFCAIHVYRLAIPCQIKIVPSSVPMINRFSVVVSFDSSNIHARKFISLSSVGGKQFFI